jgi:hypothetical protein
MVASGVRETLTSVLGVQTSVRLFRPCIPSPSAWRAIGDDARIYRLRGTRCDAAIVLRPADALAFVSGTFGEAPAETRSLSSIECVVLDRAISAIAGAFVPICGPLQEVPARDARGLHGFVTFFELQLERPSRARIGVALSREPAPEGAPQLTPHDLRDVMLKLSVRLDVRRHCAADVAALECGDLLPMTVGRRLRGTLELAGTVIALGECGVAQGRYAFVVEHIARMEGKRAE